VHAERISANGSTAYWTRSHPGAKSVSSALRELRGGSASAGGNGQARYPPPETGVYTLRGRGGEHISFPPNSQQDGATMPASVRSLGHGCWRWHLDYNVAHWEEYDFCGAGDVLLQTENRNWQSWDFGSFTVSNMARFTCPATALLAGGVYQGMIDWSCTGVNSAMAGTTTARTTAHLKGVESLRIGGVLVPSEHERQDTVLTGTQTGRVVMDWWFSESNGLPVRVARAITINTASPLGTITYTESGSWQMSSLPPRR
jgi:hypothetical protein